MKLMKFDDYSKYEEKKPSPSCSHVFEKSTDIIWEYSPDLCDKVIEYGRQGKLIEGFAGRYNVSVNAMCEWLSKVGEYPEFDDAIKISVSACVHYWTEELQHNMDLQEWTAVSHIRSILADLNKSMPKALRENLYNNLTQQSAEDKAQKQETDNLKAFINSATGGNVI